MEKDTAQSIAEGEKRRRDAEEELSTSRSPKRTQTEYSPNRILSTSASMNSTMIAHMSMKQALLDQELTDVDVPSPPLHTEGEYAAMVPDSPRSGQLDFSEEPSEPGLTFGKTFRKPSSWLCSTS
jgi:hypothetical protein